MSIFTDTFAKIWTDISGFFKEDVQPELKSFLTQFATDEGHLILTAAIAAAPALLTGNFGVVAAQVVATVVSQSETLAAQDATKTLQQVQSALQVAKVAQNIQTPADVQIVATSTAAATAGTAS